MSKDILKPGFTKGPWDVWHKTHKELDGIECWEINSETDGDNWIAQVYNKKYSKEEIGNSNARLIAAAPDLFELLRAGLEDGEPMNWDKVSDLLYKITNQE